MNERAVVDGPERDPIAEIEAHALTELSANRDRPYFDAEADAVARENYYAAIDFDTDSRPLTAALTSVLAGTHAPLRYSPSEHLYPWVDLHPDRRLRNIYSGIPVDAAKVIRQDARVARDRAERLTAAIRSQVTMAADELLELATSVEHELRFNCEHVVPQSWFARREPMRGDLHHLFACEPRCNSERGNMPYAELADTKRPVASCGRATRSRSAFEPFTGKGAVARATLYFLLRYPGTIGEREVELQRAALPTLLAWHRADPPTLYEQHRNAAIRDAQGNRNPLIDMPDLAYRLDFAANFGSPRRLMRP